MNRNHVKRSKERCLEEAFHLLKQIPEAALRGLEERQLLLLVRLLLSLQLQALSISTACRKVDQVKTLDYFFWISLRTRVEFHFGILSLTDGAAFVKVGLRVGFKGNSSMFTLHWSY